MHGCVTILAQLLHGKMPTQTPASRAPNGFKNSEIFLSYIQSLWTASESHAQNDFKGRKFIYRKWKPSERDRSRHLFVFWIIGVLMEMFETLHDTGNIMALIVDFLRAAPQVDKNAFKSRLESARIGSIRDISRSDPRRFSAGAMTFELPGLSSREGALTEPFKQNNQSLFELSAVPWQHRREKYLRRTVPCQISFATVPCRGHFKYGVNAWSRSMVQTFAT